VTEQPHYKLPTEAEIAETLARAQETIAKIAAIPPEQRRTVVNPKFEGPIGNIDAPEQPDSSDPRPS